MSVLYIFLYYILVGGPRVQFLVVYILQFKLKVFFGMCYRLLQVFKVSPLSS